MESDPTTRCPARVSIPGPLLRESDALPTELPCAPWVSTPTTMFISPLFFSNSLCQSVYLGLCLSLSLTLYRYLPVTCRHSVVISLCQKTMITSHSGLEARIEFTLIVPYITKIPDLVKPTSCCTSKRYWPCSGVSSWPDVSQSDFKLRCLTFTPTSVMKFFLIGFNVLTSIVYVLCVPSIYWVIDIFRVVLLNRTMP